LILIFAEVLGTSFFPLFVLGTTPQARLYLIANGTALSRSLWSYRGSSHELEGDYRHPVLSGVRNEGQAIPSVAPGSPERPYGSGTRH